MRLLLIVLFALAPVLAAQADMGVSRDGKVVANGGTDTANHTGTSPFNLKYTIENNGATDLTLDGTPAVAVSNPSNCSVSVVETPGTPVAGGASTTFTLQVSPVTATGFSFNVSIPNNDPDDDPYDFTFNGATGSFSGGGSGGGSSSGDCSTGESTGGAMLLLLGVLCAALPAYRSRRRAD